MFLTVIYARPKNIISDIFKPGQFQENFFDLVCFFQTIDHIPEPLDFLKEVRRILKPSGKVVCVCHNTESLGARVFGEKWPIFDIEHIYLFNRKTLSLVFQKAGFGRMETFDFANTYPLSYWLHLLLLPWFLKKVINWVLKKWKFLDFKLKLNAGNMGAAGKTY